MFFGHWQLLLSPVLASPESDRARDLYARHRYTEAAELFEQRWAADKSSDDLLNAALARQAAGDLTQANLYFRMSSGQSDLGLGAGASFLLDPTKGKRVDDNVSGKSARRTEASPQGNLSGGGLHASF